MAQFNNHLLGLKYGKPITPAAREVIAVNSNRAMIRNRGYPRNGYRRTYEVPIAVVQAIYDNQQERILRQAWLRELKVKRFHKEIDDTTRKIKERTEQAQKFFRQPLLSRMIEEQKVTAGDQIGRSDGQDV